MRRPFHIERLGDPKNFAELIRDKTITHNSPVIKNYTNQCLIFEDFRTVIELNKTIEDLLTEKYVFFKLPGITTFLKKRKQDVDDLKFEVETYNTLLIQSLFTTAVVTYAKWFTNSSGGKRTKLEAGTVFKNASNATRRTHDLIMGYRHFYFAHSGPTSLEEIFPIFIQDPGQNDKGHLFYFPSKTRLPSLAEVKRFHRLFMKAIEHVHDKMEKMKEKVMEEIKLNMRKK